MRVRSSAIDCNGNTQPPTAVAGTITMKQPHAEPLEPKVVEGTYQEEPRGTSLTFMYENLNPRYGYEYKWRYHVAIKINDGDRATDVILNNENAKVNGVEAKFTEELRDGGEVGRVTVRFPTAPRWWRHV